MKKAFAGFSPRGLRTLESLDTARKVEDFVENLGYNLEQGGDTAYSPRLVLEKREAQCLEAAVLAACAFRFHGKRPLLVDLRVVRDEDHVLAVFKQDGRWGSIAKSKFTGLRSRDPVYKSLRELVMSYFEHYYNLAGEKGLREYSVPIDLGRFDERDWMTTGEPLWFVAEALDQVRHYRLLEPPHEKSLSRVKGHLFAAGVVGHPKLGAKKL